MCSLQQTIVLMHTSAVKRTKPNFPWNTRRNWETKTNSHIERIPFADKEPRKLKEQKMLSQISVFNRNPPQKAEELKSTACDKLKLEFTRWQPTISHNQAQSRDNLAKRRTAPGQARKVQNHQKLPCLWRLRIFNKTPQVCKKSENFMLVCRNSSTSHLTPPHFRPSKQKRHVWPRDYFVNQKGAAIVTILQGA